MKAEDIASAVTFVLSAPPHVQVLLSLSFFFYFFFYLTRFLKAYQRGILLVSVLIVFIVSSDWRCADEASRAGVIAVKREAAGGADRRQPW